MIWLSYLYAVYVIFLEFCSRHKSKILFLLFSFVWDFCAKAIDHFNQDFIISPFLLLFQIFMEKRKTTLMRISFFLFYLRVVQKPKATLTRIYSLSFSSFVWDFCAKSKDHFIEDFFLSPFLLLLNVFRMLWILLISTITCCLFICVLFKQKMFFVLEFSVCCIILKLQLKQSKYWYILLGNLCIFIRLMKKKSFLVNLKIPNWLNNYP